MTTNMSAVAAPVLTIRTFEPKDYDVVRELFVEGLLYYPEHQESDGQPNDYVRNSLKADLADIEGTYLNAGGHFWVATTMDPETNESVVVGTIALERQSEIEGELRRLSVKASHRRYGLGRLLIAHMEQWAREQQFKSVYLTTGVIMKEALAFYPKVGYTEIRRDFTAETKDYEIAHFKKQL